MERRPCAGRAKKWAPRAHHACCLAGTGYGLCDRGSPFTECRAPPNRTTPPARVHGPTRVAVRPRSTGANIAEQLGRLLEDRAQARSAPRVAARRSLLGEVREGALPALLLRRFERSHLAPPGLGEPAEDDAPVLLGVLALDVPPGDEVVEHAGDRRRRHLRGLGELADRQLAALEQLDEELELRVADLLAAEARLAPAQPTQAREESAAAPCRAPRAPLRALARAR